MKRCPRDSRWIIGALTTLLALSAAYFLWRTWGRWGDIQVDFGRELYIAWQLSQGKVLYRDLAYFNGPLSPALNGLAMRVFSPSLTTILVLNTCILVATGLLVWRLAKRLASAACALVALYFFLATSACNAVSGIANYNSLTPYSHELTHGLLLLFAGLLLVARFAERQTATTAFGCGLVMGLGLLTKPEMAMAIVAAIGCGLALTLVKRPPGQSDARPLAVAAVAGTVIPPLAALAALGSAMPPAQAFDHLATMWRMAASAKVANLLFYQNVTGLAHPGSNLVLVALSIGFHLALLGYLACLGLAFSRTKPLWASHVLAMAVLVATYLLLSPKQQFDLTALLPRAWPTLLLASLLFQAAVLLKGTQAYDPIRIARLSLFVAAAVLALKIGLNANLYHYGALLLAPAGLAFTTSLVDAYPKRFADLGLRRRLTLCAAMFCLLFPLPLLRITADRLLAKDVALQTPHGVIITDKRGIFVGQALEFLHREAKPHDTVAVLPEGAMLNFLSGHANATPYATLMPPEWLLFGPQAIEAAFRDHPPDWIVLMHKSTAEYGYDYFGKGYGRNLWAFIRDHYGEKALFGARPFVNDQFGILVLQRKAREGTNPGP